MIQGQEDSATGVVDREGHARLSPVLCPAAAADGGQRQPGPVVGPGGGCHHWQRHCGADRGIQVGGMAYVRGVAAQDIKALACHAQQHVEAEYKAVRALLYMRC